MRDEEIKTYVSLTTEDYRTLRDESKQASINMWTAMQWGSALIGITLGIGLSQWNATTPATALAFAVVVPTFSTLTMAFWLGEAARFKRVGDYLCLVEQKLSLLLEHGGLLPAALNSEWPQLQRDTELALNLRKTEAPAVDDIIIRDPLSWEQWLRARKGRSVIDGHLSILYAVRLGFFLILGWGSWLLGLLYELMGLGQSTINCWLRAAILIVGFLMCSAATFSAVKVGRALNKTAGPIRRSGADPPAP